MSFWFLIALSAITIFGWLYTSERLYNYARKMYSHSLDQRQYSTRVAWQHSLMLALAIAVLVFGQAGGLISVAVIAALYIAVTLAARYDIDRAPSRYTVTWR